MGKEEKEVVRDLDITGEYGLKPGYKLHYGKVRMLTDAHFLFTGDFELEIDELINEKEKTTRKAYEFLIQTPDGEDGEPGMCGSDASATANVKITINKLKNSVRVKSVGGKGGAGGDGIPGGNGGNGGDAADKWGKGGKGADGGDGGRGGDGGKGAPAPEVTITYTPENDKAEILVLARDNTIIEEPVSYGGQGGEKGQGGNGGKGGKGGQSGDGKNAASGKCGKPGKPGKDGASAGNTAIKITKEDKKISAE